MKRIITFMGALAISCSAAAVDKLRFDGSDYRLAHVGVNGTEVTRHYQPPNDPGRAIAVRTFKGRLSTAEVIADYLNENRALLVDDPLTMAGSADDGDVVLLMFRKTNDKNVVEYDLQRFVRARDGVISYTYLERIPREGDVTPVLLRQPHRIDQLRGLSVAAKGRL